MIFKENNTSTTELVLPPITTTKPESSAEVKPNEEEKNKYKTCTIKVYFFFLTPWLYIILFNIIFLI